VEMDQVMQVIITAVLQYYAVLSIPRLSYTHYNQ